jgi:exoribonuclease R
MAIDSENASASGLDVASLLAGIRRDQGLPEAFAPEVEEAALGASLQSFADGVETARNDLTDRNFETLDPATSTDLDQAFAIAADGDDIVLSYALADIGAFAPSGGVIEREAWRRGVTVYAPDQRVSLYPAVLSQGAASLLPDVVRPAVVFDVAVDPNGTPRLISAGRAVIRSRRKRAYETTEPSDLDPLIVELHRRTTAAEARRGATKIDWPEQEVVANQSVPGGFELELRPQRPSEEINAAMSLSVNIAIAMKMLEHHTGLFRIMPGPDPAKQRSLRRVAAALHIRWDPDEELRVLLARLSHSDPHHAKFLLEARRAGRGASYALFDSQSHPFHSALASVYAHATAPMRRLADRYVIELALVLSNNPTDQSARALLSSTLGEMPEIMAMAARRAAAVENGVLDLLEAVSLVGRVGERFAATILEPSTGGFIVQLSEPPVRARAGVEESSGSHGGLGPGDDVLVELLEVDVVNRKVKFRLLPGATANSP